AHGALSNSRDARTHGGEAVRCSALVRRFLADEPHNHFVLLGGIRRKNRSHPIVSLGRRSAVSGANTPHKSKTLSSLSVSSMSPTYSKYDADVITDDVITY